MNDRIYYYFNLYIDDFDEKGELLTLEEKNRRLIRLLHAISFLHDTLLYCQGMNHIGAELLRISKWNEVDAFWLFSSFVMSKQTRLYEVYMPGLPRLHVCQYILGRLIRQFLPKLALHFETIGLNTEMFSTEWFITLFSSHCLLPPSVVSRLLDTFLYQGWKVIYRIALSILSFFEETMLVFDLEKCLVYLQRLPNSGVKDLTQEEANQIVSNSLTFKFSTAYLDDLEKVYENDTLSPSSSERNTPTERSSFEKVTSFFKKRPTSA